MIRRLFPFDKNYLMLQAQETQKEKLLNFLVDYGKTYYLHQHNPLGLIDDTIQEIIDAKSFTEEAFDEFYNDLAAIYRFKYNEVQLEFLFDGSTHFDKYSREWKEFFKQHIYAFCSNKFFLRAVLDISVFHNRDRVALLAGDRLKYFLENFYSMKVYKYRGIMELAS